MKGNYEQGGLCLRWVWVDSHIIIIIIIIITIIIILVLCNLRF